MPPNGPAIWGGCVTRRNSGRTTSPVSLADGFIRPEKEGMARVFAIRVQILSSITSVAVQGLKSAEN